MNVEPKTSLPLMGFAVLASLVWGSPQSLALTAPLTLKAAEALALAHNPGLQALRQKVRFLRHKAVAVAQLPDPHLSLGAQNIPLNSFVLSQQQMSVVQVGLSQTFPSFGTLGLEGQRVRIEARASADDREGQAADLILLLREAWLEAVYDEHAQAVVQAQQHLARAGVRAATARYRAARAGADDVLRAQLALASLSNDISTLQAAKGQARAQIARAVARGPLPALDLGWPHLQARSSGAVLQGRLFQQPLLRAAHARVQAAHMGVRVARSHYWPTITAEASYGKDFFPGSPNWLSIGVNVSLPIFPEDRQDQGVDAADAAMLQAQYRYDDVLLGLRQKLAAAVARYRAFRAEYRRTAKRLVPLARTDFSVILARYAAGRASMTAVLRSENEVLDYRIAALRYRKDAAIAAAKMDFLTTAQTEVRHGHS